MAENQTIKDRLLLYLKHKGVSARKFSLDCGLSENYVVNIKKGIQPDKITQISSVYKDLNTGWLLTGEGEMLRATGSASDSDEVSALRREVAELRETVERQNRIIDALTAPKSASGEKVESKAS